MGDSTKAEPLGWKPPECYIHHAPDGSYQIVDKDGTPLPSPPQVTKTQNGETTYTDPWGNEIPAFYPPPGEPPDGFTPPECYIHQAPDGSYQIVDKDGTPLPSPPLVTKTQNGETTYTDPWGNEIPALYPPAGEPPADWPPPETAGVGADYYIEPNDDGTWTVYDENRQAVDAAVSESMDIKKVVDETTGLTRYEDEAGREYPLLPRSFEPPECYVHVALDGSYSIVDRSGNLLPSPPHITGGVEEGGRDVVYTDPWGNEIPTFYPPPGELPDGFTPPECYVNYTGDGIQIVDATGQPLLAPPNVVQDGADGIVRDTWGNVIPPFYDPPEEMPWSWPGPEEGDSRPTVHDGIPDNIFLHRSTDGSYQVVDADGTPLSAPPRVFFDGNNPPRDPWGRVIPEYYPPAGTAPNDWPPLTPEQQGARYFIVDHGDGDYDLYDRDHNLVGSSATHPDIDGLVRKQYDQATDTYSYSLSDGSPIPPPPQPFTPPKCFVNVHPDGSYDIVDQDGNQLPAPPTVAWEAETQTFSDPWGNEIPHLYPPPGDPPEEWPPLSGLDADDDDTTDAAADDADDDDTTDAAADDTTNDETAESVSEPDVDIGEPPDVEADATVVDDDDTADDDTADDDTAESVSEPDVDVGEPPGVEQAATVVDDAERTAAPDTDSADDRMTASAEARGVGSADAQDVTRSDDDLLTAGLDADDDHDADRDEVSIDPEPMPGSAGMEQPDRDEVSIDPEPMPGSAGMEQPDGNEIGIDPEPMPGSAGMEQPDHGEPAVEVGEEAAVGIGEVEESDALLVAGLDAAGSEPELVAASPDLIPENDLTAADAEVVSVDLDEADTNPLPLPTPASATEVLAEAGAMTSQETGAIEPTEFVATTTEMKLTELEEETVAPIEVRVEVADAEVGRAAAQIEEPGERLEAVEEDSDDDEEEGEIQV